MLSFEFSTIYNPSSLANVFDFREGVFVDSRWGLLLVEGQVVPMGIEESLAQVGEQVSERRVDLALRNPPFDASLYPNTSRGTAKSVRHLANPWPVARNGRIVCIKSTNHATLMQIRSSGKTLKQSHLPFLEYRPFSPYDRCFVWFDVDCIFGTLPLDGWANELRKNTHETGEDQPSSSVRSSPQFPSEICPEENGFELARNSMKRNSPR
jgi:hypothetical protein